MYKSNPQRFMTIKSDFISLLFLKQCEPGEYCLGQQYRHKVQACDCPDEVQEVEGVEVSTPTECKYNAQQRHFLCTPKVNDEGIGEHAREASCTSYYNYFIGCMLTLIITMFLFIFKWRISWLQTAYQPNGPAVWMQ